MMEDYITPVRIANSILQKTKFKGTFLIVEGNNDFILYRKFTNDQFCQIEIAFGNVNVIKAIDELNSRGYQDALGLIDADFRILDNNIPINSNILLTDCHDLELMIFKSEAFETIIAHYSTPQKIEAIRAEHKNMDLREIFLNLALPIGYLKWVNIKNNYGLIFKPLLADGKPLTISDFISVSTLGFAGYDKLTETVINYSKNKSKVKASKDDIIEETLKIIKESTDLYHLCNGHDVVSIICIALRKKIASMNANSIPPEQLEKELIFAFDSRHFEKTKLYQQIKTWERKREKMVLKF